MKAPGQSGSVRICGLGTHPPTEATIECLAALGSCREVLADIGRHPSLEWLRSRLPGVRPASSAEAVVAAARGGGAVGLAVWGHALYTSRLAGETRRLCRERGVTVELFGSPSPPGSVVAREFIFMGGVLRAERFGTFGVDSYELEALLAAPAQADTLIPLAVYSEGAAPAVWGKLGRALGGKYPAGHRARLRGEAEEEAREVALADLGRAAPEAGAVLYVPPAGEIIKAAR